MDRNPELIGAVTSGAFATGWEHFKLYRFAERRLMRFGQPDLEFSEILLKLPPARVPALYDYVIPTDNTFDEKGYLAAIPDVDAAVRSGQLASGRDHFTRHGSFEGRLMRVRKGGSYDLELDPTRVRHQRL